MTEGRSISSATPGFDPPAGRGVIAAASLATPPGAGAVCDAHGVRLIDRGGAAALFTQGPVIVAHAAMTARRLGLRAPARSRHLLDALELFAFVRPVGFCAPSPAGLALALGWPEPEGAMAQAKALSDACAALITEIAGWDGQARARALPLAETLARAEWAWAPQVLEALRRLPLGGAPPAGTGMDAWRRLEEWEDHPPTGEPGRRPVTADAARDRLRTLLETRGLDEARPSQADYAAEVTHAFAPRDVAGAPRVVLAEAGTGVGKTLGYLAPASLSAEANGPSVWVSTYTRALQRQIDRECASLYPDPQERSRRAVVRKGRENYLCLLNFQEMSQASAMGGADAVGLALAARWIEASRDGDMTGGDFPGWLPGLFAVGPQAQASPANLVDRRGECVHAACPHYRVCFVEKAIRRSRRADLVIANHALVMSQAAFDSARGVRPKGRESETGVVSRIVFDEGHHLFDAADAAFSACLSGQETAELRRWVRGPESRGRRGRGLAQRLSDLLPDEGPGQQALARAISAAAALPGEGWSGRIAPVTGDPAPVGPLERLLAAALTQLRARSGPGATEFGLECALRPAIAPLVEAAAESERALGALEAPLLALARGLEDQLDLETARLDSATRVRLEGALRGLERRARIALPAWRALLRRLIEEEEPESREATFVDWMSAETHQDRVVDAALRRHWIDPSEPLVAAVVAPAQGVLITSATLTDAGHEDPFDLARRRAGTHRLPEPARELRLPSPFDYGRQARVFVVTDLPRDDPRATAAAMRELFSAAGGGAIGLFTAVRRLRAAYERLIEPLSARGLSLYAQHVDPAEVGALVDMFRAEEHSCLLGTDAVRDGVDVPGRSLRLLCFDRVPWPRPDLLHKARRQRFGRGWDDALARARIAQAFGRLIRRADDRGCFVLLDAQAPTRLFSSLPETVMIQRLGLAETVESVESFLRTGSGAV